MNCCLLGNNLEPKDEITVGLVYIERSNDNSVNLESHYLFDSLLKLRETGEGPESSSYCN